MDELCEFGLCGEKLTWTLEGDMLFIEGEGKMDNYTKGRSVWESVAWLVRSVNISRGVTSIGAHAFDGFPDLTDISIPETVTEIGEGAFADCSNLREITVSRRNPRYFSSEGVLIDRHSRLFVWPLEKAGKPASWFAVDENGCVFRIETGRRVSSLSGGIGSFGDSDTLIEIRESGGTIIDIECIYLTPTLHELNLFLPDYRADPDLEETEYFYCPEYDWDERHPCVVNVVRDKMEIIFSENLNEIQWYHADGRVAYYCDNEKTVVFIRVSDLTEEEYAAL